MYLTSTHRIAVQQLRVIRVNRINKSYSIVVKATSSKLNDLKEVEKKAQKRLSRLSIAFS